MFTSPLTGRDFNINYSQETLAAPLPFNESGGGNQDCDIFHVFHDNPCSARS